MVDDDEELALDVDMDSEASDGWVEEAGVRGGGSVRAASVETTLRRLSEPSLP